MQKKIIVFGGTSGIGLAAAAALSRDGFVLHATGREAGKIARLRAAYPQIRFHEADSASDAALARCLEEIGAVDHVVLALGGAKGAGPVRELKLEDLIEGFSAKLFGQLRSLQAVLPRLSPAGSVTFISGVSAQMADAGTAGLAAINGAIEAMIRPLAVELAPIRVNGISPGAVRTPWWNWMPDDRRNDAFQHYAKASLAGRMGEPDDLAAAVQFLVANTFTTGVVLTCDGGLRLKTG